MHNIRESIGLFKLEVFSEFVDFLREALAQSTLRPFFRVSGFVERLTPVARTPEFLNSRKGEILMALALPATHQVNLSVEVRDRLGNPAEVQDPLEWSTDNVDLLALTPSDDGRTCQVAAVGPLGMAVVTLRADADLGEGVVHIVGSLEVTVTAGTATVVELVADTPVEQPVPPVP